jgi:hypothetical protein
LSISDGINSANIALLGSYIASTFATPSNGHGATLMTEAQSANQYTPLSLPHA